MNNRNEQRAVTISERELQELVDKHCNERLSAFGIDWNSPNGTREFIEDMMYLRRLRITMHSTARFVFFAILGATITGLCGLLWIGFLAKLKAVRGN